VHGDSGDHVPAADDGCADCGGHGMMLATCILILTLIRTDFSTVIRRR
jgi:hypothetical protein